MMSAINMALGSFNAGLFFYLGPDAWPLGLTCALCLGYVAYIELIYLEDYDT